MERRLDQILRNEARLLWRYYVLNLLYILIESMAVTSTARSSRIGSGISTFSRL